MLSMFAKKKKMLCNVHLMIFFPHHTRQHISRHDAITLRHNVKDDLWCQNVLNLWPPVLSQTQPRQQCTSTPALEEFFKLQHNCNAQLNSLITEKEWGRHLGWP